METVKNIENIPSRGGADIRDGRRRDMKRGPLIIGLILVLAALLPAFSAPEIFPGPLSPRIANYDIKVKLDPESRTITAEETLHWKNKSKESISSIPFHLYLNAFRNTRSTFVKEWGTEKVRKKLEDDGWGYIEVESITLAGGRDITGRSKYIHPDDDNEDDKTVLLLDLPEPVPPGGELELEIDFKARLPEPPVARSGAKKEFFFVAQWFPKAGVYEDGEWNCHQYHGNSEFYADFGVYNVWITVPEDHVVGATGLEFDREDNGDGTVTHYYRAEDVHDFAWTSSPRFVEVTGKSQDVDIRVLMQKERAYQGERHLEAARQAVRYFQDWYGDYPFPNLTVVDPRRGASAAGGMEYPTLITAGTVFGMPEGIHAVEMLIIHEFGHNYWYHMVASDEFEEAWLDEGINTYSEIKILHDLYEPEASMIDFLGVKADDMQARRYSYVRLPDADPVVRHSWEFYSRGSYGAMAYSKPALGLLTLDYYLGDKVMRDILRSYLEKYRFKHPRTEDFIEVANETAPENLDWFFDQLLFTNHVLDYAVADVSTREIKPPKGYGYTLDLSGDKIEQDKAEKEEKMYESEVRIRRLGGFKFPVKTAVEFEDGEVIKENWDGKELWKIYRYKRPSKLKKAMVDPDNEVVLDINTENNEKTIAEKKLSSAFRVGGYVNMLQFILDPK